MSSLWREKVTNGNKKERSRRRKRRRRRARALPLPLPLPPRQRSRARAAWARGSSGPRAATAPRPTSNAASQSSRLPPKQQDSTRNGRPARSRAESTLRFCTFRSQTFSWESKTSSCGSLLQGLPLMCRLCLWGVTTIRRWVPPGQRMPLFRSRSLSRSRASLLPPPRKRQRRRLTLLPLPPPLPAPLCARRCSSYLTAARSL